MSTSSRRRSSRNAPTRSGCSSIALMWVRPPLCGSLTCTSCLPCVMRLWSRSPHHTICCRQPSPTPTPTPLPSGSLDSHLSKSSTATRTSPSADCEAGAISEPSMSKNLPASPFSTM